MPDHRRRGSGGQLRYMVLDRQRGAGNPAEHERAVARIAAVPLPKKDPVFGKSGVAVWQAG